MVNFVIFLGMLAQQYECTIYCTHTIITYGLYIVTPAFIVVYVVEQLVLQTIYVLNEEILQFLGLKSAVYNQKRFQIKSWLQWRAYGIFRIFELCIPESCGNLR